MLQRMLLKVRLWLRYRRKTFLVNLGESRLGGPRIRVLERHRRRHEIFWEKRAVIEDLYRSWKIGEIRQPSKEHLEAIETLHEALPWTILIEIKKSYWHENI